MNPPANDDLANLIKQEPSSSRSSSNQPSPPMTPDRRMMRQDLKKLDSLLGTLSIEEDGMISYVASDLEDQLRNSANNQTTGSRQDFLNELARPKDFYQPDVMLLEDLETEAELIAKSLSIMMKNINDFVTQVTKLTSASAQSCREYLCTACDSVDANIKKMYQIMAKCEELSIQMQPIKQLQDDIEKVNKLLDLLDKELDGKPV